LDEGVSGDHITVLSDATSSTKAESVPRRFYEYGFRTSHRSSNRPVTYPSAGTLTLDGKPVEGATVSFTPASGPGAVGVTDVQGRFDLTTFARGDGAVAGEHVVTITRFDSPKPAGGDGGEYVPPTAPLPSPKSTFPKRFADAATSGLKVTIEPKGGNVVPLDLRADKP